MPVENLKASVFPGGDSIRVISSRENRTYIASFGQGIEKLENLERVPVWPTSVSSADQVLSVHQGESGLWVGTREHGSLLLAEGDAMRLDALAELSNRSVWAILENADTTWFGTDQGLFALVNDKLKRVIEGVDARALAPGKQPEGSVWCATNGSGLYKALINPEGDPIISRVDTEQGLPSPNLFAVITSIDDRGVEELVVGSNRGISSYRSSFAKPSLGVSRVVGSRLYEPEEISAGASPRLSGEQSSGGRRGLLEPHLRGSVPV